MRMHFLAQHVYLCVTPESAIILDVKNDEYLGLTARQSLALTEVIQGWPRYDTDIVTPTSEIILKAPDELLDALVAKGLLTDDHSRGKAATPERASPVHEALVDQVVSDNHRIRASHLISFIRSCIQARRMFKRNALHQIAARAMALKSSRPQVITPGNLRYARDVTSIFFLLRPFFYTSKK